VTTATATGARATAPPAIGRLIIPLLALAVFINYIDRGTLPTAAPLIKDELHLNSVQVGVLISAFFWTYTPGQVLAGWLGERFNPYRTLAAGLAIWSIATALTGVASGFAVLLGLRLLLGLGETAIFPCSSKIIAQNMPGHRLGWPNALLTQGVALGPAVGTLIGGLVMAAMGWRYAFLLFGLASLLWLVPWLWATRGAAAPTAFAAPEDHEVPSFRAILARRELWGAALGHMTGNYGFYFVISWLPLYLVKDQGYSMARMAEVGSLVYLTFAVGALVSGQLSDRWMSAGGAPNLVRKTVAVSSPIVSAAGLAVCALGGPQVAIASLFVVSFAFGFGSPNIFASAQTLAGPHAAGKWVGLQNCVGNIAGIVGPIVTGFIVDGPGGFPAAFGVAGAVVVVGALGWGVIIPKIEPLDWRPAAQRVS
jgi:MFS family permease